MNTTLAAATVPHPAFGFLAATLTGAAAPWAFGQCGYELTPSVTGGLLGNPVSTALADFNRDGHLDLAVSSQANAAVSFYPGNGTGGFGFGQVVGAGVIPDALCVGDFNGDGWIDCATAGNAGLAGVFINNGGTMGAAVTYPGGGSGSVGIATADFNGDGRLDLALTNASSATVSVMMGNGAGAFLSPANYGVGAMPTAVVVADFNADARPDLAIANQTSGTISILICNAGGTFTALAPISAGIAGPRWLVAADFNQDGLPDLAAGSITATNPNVSFLYGNGPGTFAAGLPRWYGNGTVQSLCVADTAPGGPPDLLMGIGATLYTVGNTDTTGPAGNSTSGLVRGVSAGDLNHDGLVDVVHLSSSQTQYRVFLNTTTYAPAITQQPQAITTNPGVPATISVSAIGTAPLTYRWRRGGVILTAGPAYAGLNTPTLTVVSPTLADNLAVFDCEIFNTCGLVTTRPVGVGSLNLAAPQTSMATATTAPTRILRRSSGCLGVVPARSRNRYEGRLAGIATSAAVAIDETQRGEDRATNNRARVALPVTLNLCLRVQATRRSAARRNAEVPPEGLEPSTR